MTNTRARLIRIAAILLIAVAAACSRPAEAAGPEILVHKTPTCGCCSAWVDHLREEGFRVAVQDHASLNVIKHQHGVPGELASCHTAVVDGYTVEGHVPADVIRRMLAERPEARGVAVPGMPMGSPGMEGPYSEPYEVYLFTADGPIEVYEMR